MFVISNNIVEIAKGLICGGISAMVVGYFIVQNVDTIDYYYDKYFNKKSN